MSGVVKCGEPEISRLFLLPSRKSDSLRGRKLSARSRHAVLRFSPKTIGLVQPAMPRLVPLVAYMAPHTPAKPHSSLAALSAPALATDTKRRSRRRSRAGRSGRSAPLWKLRKRRGGAERRAERHAAARFGACAAEHAARRGGCIRPTKHRGAKRRGGDGRAGAGSGSEAEAPRGRDEHPRCHGRQVSPPQAEHTEAARGGVRRTATRRRICIRRAYPPSAKREPRSGR